MELIIFIKFFFTYSGLIQSSRLLIAVTISVFIGINSNNTVSLLLYKIKIKLYNQAQFVNHCFFMLFLPLVCVSNIKYSWRFCKIKEFLTIVPLYFKLASPKRVQEAISMKIEPDTNQEGHSISNVLVISMSSPPSKVDELPHITQANHWLPSLSDVPHDLKVH